MSDFGIFSALVACFPSFLEDVWACLAEYVLHRQTHTHTQTDTDTTTHGHTQTHTHTHSPTGGDHPDLRKSPKTPVKRRVPALYRPCTGFVPG